jgi:hypothetical protein
MMVGKYHHGSGAMFFNNEPALLVKPFSIKYRIVRVPGSVTQNWKNNN